MPVVRAELAAAIGVVNDAFNRLPSKAQDELKIVSGPLDAEIDAAIAAGDHDRARSAIAAWRGYWLDEIAKLGCGEVDDLGGARP
jgi:hypothetical protein